MWRHYCKSGIGETEVADGEPCSWCDEKPPQYQFAPMPTYSGWKCYMFGNVPGGTGFIYTPTESNVPNFFVRWMMKLCFACTWVKEK